MSGRTRPHRVRASTRDVALSRETRPVTVSRIGTTCGTHADEHRRRQELDAAALSDSRQMCYRGDVAVAAVIEYHALTAVIGFIGRANSGVTGSFAGAM